MVDKPGQQDRIADLLAAYGSDVSRWPADGQAAMAALSPEVRAALLRDDAALDALFVKAATTVADAPAPDDLMVRILAAVPAGEGAAPGAPGPTRSEKVIDLRPAATIGAVAGGQVARQNLERAAVGALLAASLVLGLFVGTIDRVRETAYSVSEIAGISLTASAVQMTALDEALQTQDDEEFL